MPRMYMIVERFKNSDAIAVYRRFRDHARMTPEGLSYVSSWVDVSQRLGPGPRTAAQAAGFMLALRRNRFVGS